MGDRTVTVLISLNLLPPWSKTDTALYSEGRGIYLHLDNINVERFRIMTIFELQKLMLVNKVHSLKHSNLSVSSCQYSYID